MNILVIGSGAREHALAWKLKQSPNLGALYAAPGNAGLLQLALNAGVDVNDAAGVIAFCKAKDIGLIVIGPEAPLVAGLGDALRAAGFTVFGPSKAAAELEASKAFTKAICDERNIPTAAYATFTNLEQALSFVQAKGAPLVVKADGLAAGKGVVICKTNEEAEAALNACFGGAFGSAGARVVIEEFLEGEEVSFFALCDGVRAVPLTSAQDYKRAFDGDEGPNTGGMGAVSPAPMMTDKLAQTIMTSIINPTLEAMAARGTPFEGVLYAGLMITAEGPKLIEYNVRFGDPECQVLMLRLKSDLLTLLTAAAKSNLSGTALQWREEAAVTVVMAANGYPTAPKDGTVIAGTASLDHIPETVLFHAGTSLRNDGALIAKGGRVLNVAALGADVSEAQTRAYAALKKIDWPGGFYRHDIGWRSIKRT